MNDVTINGAGLAGDATVTDITTHPNTVANLVTLLAESALALSEQAARAPSSVRISAGPVVVEISWLVSAPLGVATQESQSGQAQSPRSVQENGSDLPPAAAPIAAPTDTFTLSAGTVGTFYRAPEPGAAPFVTEGDRVQPGQQVAIIEAMKLMIPVEAERAGEVVEFLVDDRAPVEYGQPLMRLREAGQ